MQVFDFIEELDRKSTAGDVMDLMQRDFACFGCETLMVKTWHEEPFEPFEPSILATRWPADYLKLYIAEHYSRFDPISRRVRRCNDPFEWRTADFAGEPESRSREVMYRAAECGLTQGFIVPIRGPRGLEASVSLAGTHIELTSHLKPAVHLAALYAYERLRSILAVDRHDNPPLTDREREVLTWIANGKSAWEIGEILGIAKRTVDEHTQTAARKLNAVNRTQAVVIALRSRMIEV